MNPTWWLKIIIIIVTIIILSHDVGVHWAVLLVSLVHRGDCSWQIAQLSQGDPGDSSDLSWDGWTPRLLSFGAYSEHGGIQVWREPDWKASLGNDMPLPPHSFAKNKAGVHFQSRGREKDSTSDGKYTSPTGKDHDTRRWDSLRTSIVTICHSYAQMLLVHSYLFLISLLQEPWEVVYYLLYFHSWGDSSSEKVNGLPTPNRCNKIAELGFKVRHCRPKNHEV